MDTIFDITNLTVCDIAQIVGESNRFLFHVMLVHIATIIIEQKKSFFSEEFFRTLVITSTAIVLYHLFFRKIAEPKIEKMKLICYADKDKQKKQEQITQNREPDERNDQKSSKTTKTIKR